MEKDLKIFTKNIENEAVEQINGIMDQVAFKDSKVRIMPDVHAGKGCVVGFTAKLGDKIIPAIVGGDIGCGMFCANIGKVDIDFDKLDNVIRNCVPSGIELHSQIVSNFELEKLKCFKSLRHPDRVKKSLGTLGGGNHFIEIDKDEDDNKYLIVHTGSRSLGTEIARCYQSLADKVCNYGYLDYLKKIKDTIEIYKIQGREKELESVLKELKKEENIKINDIPYYYTYVEGEYKDNYLHDMKIGQEFAVQNRKIIAETIANEMGFNIDDYFESVHNYISFDDNIVRKGAISAKKGEQVIIPMNMRDGCIIGVGKGNSDWNYSAPHGAGRIFSRSEAKKKINLEDYKKSMEGIYTTSVNDFTIDESPFVYKPTREIVENIEPTVEIKRIIKPIYNYKANK